MRQARCTERWRYNARRLSRAKGHTLGRFHLVESPDGFQAEAVCKKCGAVARFRADGRPFGDAVDTVCPERG